MSVVDERVPAPNGNLSDEGNRLSATTDICAGLLIALAVSVLGSAILQQRPAAGAPPDRVETAMSFIGP
jgi:hypothetical protein